MQNCDTSSRKLRIAVLGLRGFPGVQGGIERHCQELYPRLAELGCDITLFARKSYVPQPHPYTYKNVKIIPLWAPRMKNLEAICHTAIGIFRLSKHPNDYDILHIHGIGPSLLAYPASHMNFRLVITHHGPDYKRLKWGAFAKTMLRRGERLGAKHAYLIIAVSKHIKTLLLDKYDSYAAYIPNGVTIPKAIPPGPVLSNFGLSPGRYFLAVGRLVPEKGFHDLLNAYERSNTDWKLVIVGDADHEDYYSKRLKKGAKNVDGVVMTGFQTGEALAELYSNAGLFVLPSYHEGLPIAGLEAMGCNLPILLSDIPSNKELAFREETFSVGDIEALSQRLSAFSGNPPLFNSPHILAEKRKRLETEFNWDIIAKKTVDLYRAVVKMPHRMGTDSLRRLQRGITAELDLYGSAAEQKNEKD
ncbi:MAG: hypothetical protein B6240_13910 [Desulfobacteraceae bacterium 4572_87]|nr:MAG: hypothetical protein B6240_13910 [Desulfobacteraceae bacterium 4572_87]